MREKYESLALAQLKELAKAELDEASEKTQSLQRYAG